MTCAVTVFSDIGILYTIPNITICMRYVLPHMINSDCSEHVIPGYYSTNS